MSDHIEGDLGEVVVLPGEDLLEAADCLLHRHQLARVAGEHLSHLENYWKISFIIGYNI